MEVKELWQSLNFACTIGFWRMAVLWTVSLVISYFQLLIPCFFSPKSKSCFNPSQRLRTTTTTPSSTTARIPVCIITGATSGLGAAAALALSKKGFYVVLVGRSSHQLSKATSDIRRQNKDAKVKGFQVNLSSFQSIMQFNNTLQQWLLDSDMHPSIQLLINNAGILATSYRPTTEGYDEIDKSSATFVLERRKYMISQTQLTQTTARMMGTNYVGAFFLTKVLLPHLQNSPSPSRIVNVTSFTHRNVYDVQVDKGTVSGKCFSRLNNYPFAHVYEYSKLFLLLFSYELHRQLHCTGQSPHVSIIAADPGLVKTSIMREVPFYISQFAFSVFKLLGLLHSPHCGVRSIIDAALAAPETSGVYYFGGNGRTLNSSSLSYNTKLSKELWATSCELFDESMQASPYGSST